MQSDTPSDPPRRFVELPRGRAAYTDEGEGPPIVLVHGVPGSGRDFRWLAPPLSAGARVLRLDMPGFGETPTRTAPGLAPVDRARFVLAFIDALGLERPLLAGHSMGGIVVTAAASLVPNGLAGLVYVAAPGYTRHAGFAKPLWLFARAIDAPVVSRLVRHVMRRGFVAQGFKGHSEEVLFRTLRTVQHTDIDQHAERLRRLRVPALVSYSEDDRLIEAAIGAALVRGLGARSLVFPDGGHNPQKAHAMELAPAMLAFAERTRTGVPSTHEASVG